MDLSGQRDTADRVIRNHIVTAMGVGLVPLPMLDLVGVTGVQLNMLRRLAWVYEVPFSEHQLKSVLTALVGGTLTVPVAAVVLSLVKVIPLLGTSIAAVTLPVTAGASTYAVGKVFHQHFASGGTFLTFDPDLVQAHYKQMFAEGQRVASNVKSD